MEAWWGESLVLALYLWLFFRAGLIIRRSRSTYGAFLAFGLSMGLVLQAFVNMAVAVGLVPVTGQTLPLVSMGGSSIIFHQHGHRDDPFGELGHG